MVKWGARIKSQEKTDFFSSQNDSLRPWLSSVGLGLVPARMLADRYNKKPRIIKFFQSWCGSWFPGFFFIIVMGYRTCLDKTQTSRRWSWTIILVWQKFGFETLSRSKCFFRKYSTSNHSIAPFNVSKRPITWLQRLIIYNQAIWWETTSSSSHFEWYLRRPDRTSSRWPSSPYYLMRNSDEMTIENAHYCIK